MLGAFRGLLNTWPARLLFLMLAAAFALWGVANKNPFGSDSNALATVGGTTIELQQAEQAFQRNLAFVQRQRGAGAELSADERRIVAIQSVEQLIADAALQARVRDLGLVVPDSALRDAVYAVPQFHGRDGRFDHQTMLAVLQANGLTEQAYLELKRNELAQTQLLGSVAAGATASKLLDRRLFDFLHETRTAKAVDFPSAAAADPAPPSDAQLHRWYDNHPSRYNTHEYRRIKAIVLSPETVEKDISIGDDELRAYYDQHKAEYVTVARRSVQVLTVPNEQTADTLAARWSTGADWTAIQAAAEAAGATAVQLDDATEAEFPSPELAAAAFATNPDTVAPPVRGSLGWYVVKVTKAVSGGTESFDAALPAIRARILADKASDVIDANSVKVDDMLQGGTALDMLPGDLGLGAVTGTLDASGMTPAGRPAPIPGSAALRGALVAAAFQAHPGDPLKLQQAPGTPNGAAEWFAVSVERIEPPKPKPYEQVADALRTDWVADARRREQDAAATKLMVAAQQGAGLDAASKAAGLVVRTLPSISRTASADGVPPSLTGPLFGLRQGETTMIETGDGFMVVSLAKIDDPTPESDPVGHARVLEGLDRQLAADAQQSFAEAVRTEARPRVNQTLLDRLAQPGD